MKIATQHLSLFIRFSHLPRQRQAPKGRAGLNFPRAEFLEALTNAEMDGKLTKGPQGYPWNSGREFRPPGLVRSNREAESTRNGNGSQGKPGLRQGDHLNNPCPTAVTSPIKLWVSIPSSAPDGLAWGWVNWRGAGTSAQGGHNLALAWASTPPGIFAAWSLGGLPAHPALSQGNNSQLSSRGEGHLLPGTPSSPATWGRRLAGCILGCNAQTWKASAGPGSKGDTGRVFAWSDGRRHWPLPRELSPARRGEAAPSRVEAGI